MSFTVGEIKRVQEELDGLVPKSHKDIPQVVLAGVKSGVLRDLVAVTYHDGDLLVQLRISDLLHLSSGWTAIQYHPFNFERYLVDVLLDILIWVHEQAQKLKTAHRLYHERY